MGMFDGVKKMFQRATEVEKGTKMIELDPENATGYKTRSVGYAKEGRYYEAYRDLVKAISLQPEDAEGHYLLGACQNKRSRYDEALESFGKALELNPNLAGAYVGRAYSRKVLGIDDGIRADLDKGLELTNNRYLRKMAERMIKDMEDEEKRKKLLARSRR